MNVSGIPNKYEIFQDFYYEENGVMLSYRDALSLFSQMDNETKSSFEQYYKDETGYEVIYYDGFNIDYDPQKSQDGSKVKAHNLKQKYTIEAYAKKSGKVLDPVWGQYSAEEIIQMENEGVCIPQDIIDIAHTIAQSDSSNYGDESSEGEDSSEDTTEKEPFLELIPKAIKNIKDCKETQENISEEIEALLPEKQKQEKSLKDKLKTQKNSLKEYQDILTEWQSLKDKMDDGETLSATETKRYAELSDILGAKKQDSEEISIDKKEIASSLSELNILALLGEQLSDKTIEIGETLEDYTCKANYATTSKEVSAAVGPFFTLIAMAHGKNVGEEAVKIGNVTKEYTEETATSVNEIAETLDITGSIATVDEEGNVIEPEESTAETDEKQDEEEELKDKFFWVTDDEVKQYISEAKNINADLYKQIKIALSQIKVAKSDVKYAEFANKIVTKVVNEFLAAEKVRQAEIKKEEEQKQEAEKKANDAQNKINEAQNKIKELEETKKTNEEYADGSQNENSEINDKIQEQEGIVKEQNKVATDQNKIIDEHNKEIEKIQLESEQHREQVKQQTIKEKTGIDKATNVENEALKINTLYQEQKLPEHNDRMDFINRAGLNLMIIGTGELALGGYYRLIGAALMSNIFTMKEGLYYTILGTGLIIKGAISLAIGATARKVSDDESLIEDAEKTTDSADNNINKALTDLGGVNDKLASVVEEYSTEEEGAEGTQGADGQGAEEGSEDTQDAGKTEGSEGNTQTPANQAPAAGQNSAPQQTVSTTQVPAAQTAQTTTVQQATKTPAEQKAPSAQENSQEGSQQGADKTDSPKNLAAMLQTNLQASLDKKFGPIEKQNKDDKTVNNTSRSSKKDEKGDKKDSGSVAGITSSAKDDSKDSQNVKKDTEKDEKELEKEAKKLQKTMKKDQKQVEKMTKESQKAAKKQEEILAEYETLVADNEQIMAEQEQGKADKAAMQPAGQPAGQPATQGAQGAAPTASNSFSQDNGSSDAADKLETNGQRINVLSNEFKHNERVINRNIPKIKRIQKSTKTNNKKFNKKIKVRENKIKEAEKKEQDKQKRLAKQLGVVGIFNNLFSITLSTGLAMIATGWGATAGHALVKIGTKGIIACGLANAAINIANGNWQAALISLGTTAITAATAGAGAGEGVNAVLATVGAGLNVVSSSAELVNNVRAVQGKEASGLFGKISAVAGIAAAGVNIASSFTQTVTKTTAEGAKQAVNAFKAAGTFGKSMMIASAVGQALSSTSKVMNEFGAEGKLSEILGTVGGAVSLAASVGQLAAAKMEKAENQNKETQEKAEEIKNEGKTENQNSNGAEKTEEQKQAETEQKQQKQKTEDNKNQTKNEKEIKDPKTKEQQDKVKADEKVKKEHDKAVKKQEKQNKKDELKNAKDAKKEKNTEAKDVKDKNQKKNIKENGSSKKFADKDDNQLDQAIEQAKEIGDRDTVIELADEINSRREYKQQMKLLSEHSAKKQENFSKIMNFTGSAANTAISLLASGQKEEQNQDTKKAYKPGELTERTKKIIKARQRRINSLAKYQRYYA